MTKPSRSRSKGREARSGVVVARGERPHGAEAADAQRRDGRLAAARDHGVGVAPLDVAERLPQRVSTGGAGGGGGRVRALGARADRDPARGQVHDGGRDEEGAHLARAAVHQLGVLALDGREPADAAADEHAHLVRVPGADREAGILHREVRGRHRELDEAVHLLDFLLLDPPERVEPLHLAREVRRVLGRVEEGDGAGPRAAFAQARPRLLGADAEGRDEAHARDDDSAICSHDCPSGWWWRAYFLALSPPCFSM